MGTLRLKPGDCLRISLFLVYAFLDFKSVNKKRTHYFFYKSVGPFISNLHFSGQQKSEIREIIPIDPGDLFSSIFSLNNV